MDTPTHINCKLCNSFVSVIHLSRHLRKIHNFEEKESILQSVEMVYNVPAAQIATEYSDGNSLPFLSEKYKIGTGVIDRIVMTILGKRRTISESKFLSLDKYKTTCFMRYGVDNVSKLESIQDKKVQTFLLHYGVDNIFKDEKFKSNLSKTMLSKYGVLRITEQMLKAFKPKTEALVEEWLKEAEVLYVHPFYIKGKQFDFFLPNAKMVLEVHGNFWHANPLMYKAEDILPHPKPTGLITASKLWERDKAKEELAIKSGYTYYVIWESELAFKRGNKIKQKIQIETKEKLLNEYKTRKIAISQEDQMSIKTI